MACVLTVLTLPSALKSLHLGHHFDQNLDLPPGLEYLRIGSNFSRAIALPEGLQGLEWYMNRHVELPKSLKHVLFGVTFKKRVNLHEGLETVEFATRGIARYGVYNEPLDLPRGLKSIVLAEEYALPLVLPEGCVRRYVQ